MVRVSSRISLRISCTSSPGPASCPRPCARDRSRCCADARAPPRRGRDRRTVGEPLQHRPQLELLLGEAQHQALLGAHLVGQRAQAIGQRVQRRIGGDAALLAARQDALEIVETIGGLLEQCLDIGRHRGFAQSRPDGPPPDSRV